MIHTTNKSKLTTTHMPWCKTLLANIVASETEHAGRTHLVYASDAHGSHSYPHYDDGQREDDVRTLAISHGPVKALRRGELVLHASHLLTPVDQVVSSTGTSLLSLLETVQLQLYHLLKCQVASWSDVLLSG